MSCVPHEFPPVPDLAARLRELRAARGWTQEEAAEAIGLHAKQLQRMEGAKANPTLATLVAVAAAYGVDLGALFDSVSSSGASSQG